MDDEKFLKNIMPEIEHHLILNNRGYLIEPPYEWFREVITLYAKQHNLLEATITLLDRGMNEEAYVLARSAMNNCFLIGYLLKDDAKRCHLKEYQTQPLIAQRYLLENMKRMLDGKLGIRMDQIGEILPYTVRDIEIKINEAETKIKNEGFSRTEKPLSIRKLAEESDAQGFDFYATYYADASKFEHSDISSLDIYKRPIDEKTPINDAFFMDLSRTDGKLKYKIYEIFIISYLDSFLKITDVILNKEIQLQMNYDINKLVKIITKILEYINNKKHS